MNMTRRMRMRQRRAYLFRRSVVMEVGFCLLSGQKGRQYLSLFCHVEMAGVENNKYIGFSIG